MRIVALREAPLALATLARLYEETWAPYYGPHGPGDAAADLRASLGAETLPRCFVTFERDDLLGAATLSASSISHPHLAPRATAHVVRPEARGIGTALLPAVESDARNLGFDHLHLSTEPGHGLVERRG